MLRDRYWCIRWWQTRSPGKALRERKSPHRPNSKKSRWTYSYFFLYRNILKLWGQNIKNLVPKLELGRNIGELLPQLLWPERTLKMNVSPSPAGHLFFDRLEKFVFKKKLDRNFQISDFKIFRFQISKISDSRFQKYYCWNLTFYNFSFFNFFEKS